MHQRVQQNVHKQKHQEPSSKLHGIPRWARFAGHYSDVESCKSKAAWHGRMEHLCAAALRLNRRFHCNTIPIRCSLIRAILKSNSNNSTSCEFRIYFTVGGVWWWIAGNGGF